MKHLTAGLVCGGRESSRGARKQSQMKHLAAGFVVATVKRTHDGVGGYQLAQGAEEMVKI